MRQTKTPMYRSRVVLRAPSLAALIDCMRYESMCPDQEADSNKLAATIYERGTERGTVEVALRRYSMNPGEPNRSRLASFGVVLVSWEPAT